MSKTGLRLATIKPILSNASGTGGWVLCIGAGTSLPAFRSWRELVEDLVRGAGDPDPATTTDQLLNSFTPDALIQAAQDRLDMNDEDFAGILADALYSPLQSRVGAANWDTVSQILNARGPGAIISPVWEAFAPIRQTHLDSTTASALANIIVETENTTISPAAIFSFNAEPLMYALINHTMWIKRTSQTPAAPLEQYLDMVTHITSIRRSGRLPYFFCHGLLPVPDLSRRGKGLRRAPYHSIDKLVFSESQYLQLANASFTWQASAFFDAAVSRRIVFVGVSLSDPNMRRWLSWVHTIRKNELELLRSYEGPSTTHLWLNKRPSRPESEAWIESAVAHLGVRVVWLDDWSETGAALRRLLGLT